jgi:hypothetical protein
MKGLGGLLLVAWVSVAAAADDEFLSSKIVDVQAKQGASNGVFGGGVEADNYTEITIEVGDKKVTARTYSMGGGIIYLANHPEAIVVGASVRARLARRGELHIETADGKLLKFKIQRLEQL